MIKDRHLGVSRDVMHSVGRSHLPIFFSGLREVCHVMPCVQCKGNIYLFPWTERNTSPDVMRSLWRSHLPVCLGREICHVMSWDKCEGHVMSCGVMRSMWTERNLSCDVMRSNLFVWAERNMSCGVMRSMWTGRNLSRDVMRSMWRSHLPVCLDRQIFEWQNMLSSFNMIIVDILFRLFPAAKKLQ